MQGRLKAPAAHHSFKSILLMQISYQVPTNADQHPHQHDMLSLAPSYWR